MEKIKIVNVDNSIENHSIIKDENQTTNEEKAIKVQEDAKNNEIDSVKAQKDKKTQADINDHNLNNAPINYEKGLTNHTNETQQITVDNAQLQNYKNSIDIELNRIKEENNKLKLLLEQAKKNIVNIQPITYTDKQNEIKRSKDTSTNHTTHEESSEKVANNTKTTSSFDKLRSFSDIKKKIEQIFPSISESSSKNQINLKNDLDSNKNLKHSDKKEVTIDKTIKEQQNIANCLEEMNKKINLERKEYIDNHENAALQREEGIKDPFNLDNIKHNKEKDFFEINENVLSEQKMIKPKLIKPNEKLGPQTEFFSMKKNLLKKILDNDIKKTPMKPKYVYTTTTMNRSVIEPNDYIPKTLLPLIDANDKAESWFKPPDWINDPNIINIVKNQNNKEIEACFLSKEDLDIIKMFPDQKNATNDSPNRWPIQR